MAKRWGKRWKCYWSYKGRLQTKSELFIFFLSQGWHFPEYFPKIPKIFLKKFPKLSLR